jgi:hypothetical protein
MLLSRYKPHVRKVLTTFGIRWLNPRWVVAADEPSDPSPLGHFGLFGLTAAWMEGDVIGATVRNAFAQGCERVFLVDNDSPDDTVEQALGAGAELAASFSTPHYDELARVQLLNETVERLSRQDGRSHIWWLWFDADEFVHGPQGLTVHDLLSRLDRRYRVVGTRYFNHFPDRKPEAVRGFHPLDFQPLCEEFVDDQFCSLGHRKHPLQRFDRDGPPITSHLGFHQARCTEPLYEPPVSCFLHHFPYRDEAATRARTEALCGRSESDHAAPRIALLDDYELRRAGTMSDVSKRRQTLDQVYSQRWGAVENLRRRGRRLGVRPRPWSSLVSAPDATTRRWYTSDELAAVMTTEPVARTE